MVYNRWSTEHEAQETSGPTWFSPLIWQLGSQRSREAGDLPKVHRLAAGEKSPNSGRRLAFVLL